MLAFVAISAFWVLLSLLCLGNAATSDDQTTIIRLTTTGLVSAFLAFFWPMVGRRYSATGSFANAPLTNVLVAVGAALLILLFVAFRVTD